MSGCELPVVINSGSGNQGLTVSLPVIEYAREIGASQDRLYRALVVSNLVAIHQKNKIGWLSAFCGAVTAACGSGAAITYLSGGSYEDISHTMTMHTVVSDVLVIGGAGSAVMSAVSALRQGASVTLVSKGKVGKSGNTIMIGAGIFSILGVVAQASGGALWISFAIGGVVALLSSYSYAKLGARYPSAGGAVEFLVKGFGDGVVSGGINISLWIGYIIALALYAQGFAGYACVHGLGCRRGVGTRRMPGCGGTTAGETQAKEEGGNQGRGVATGFGHRGPSFRGIAGNKP